MKYKYVFLVGRPGCGKSVLHRELKKRILESGRAKTIERVDDFPKLWAKFLRDDALEKAGKERIDTGRSAAGDYKITNDNIMNDILVELDSDLLKIDKPEHMIFLEFARSNYIEALQNFNKSIFDNCLVIYLEVAFEICWQRNVARHEAAIAERGVEIAEGGDDHLVPRKEMEKRYLYDDQVALVQYLRDQNIPVSVVNNDADGEEHLRKQVEQLFENLF